jgi:hypothetical protein
MSIREKTDKLRRLFEMNLQGDTAEFLEMPHVEFGQQSPLPGHDEIYGIVDFQIEKMPLSKEEKKRLTMAFFTTGFVGKVFQNGRPHGWLFMSSERGGTMHKATDLQVQKLPHLPDDWEKYMRNTPLEDKD